MRLTQLLCPDPTNEEIAQKVLDLGLPRPPSKTWVLDLFQCFEAELPRDALTRPSTWEIEGTQEDKIRIREEKKMQQMTLLAIVRHNLVEGDSLTKAIINTLKLIDYLDRSGTKFSDMVPSKQGQKVKLDDLIRGLEKATDEIKKIRSELDPLIGELLGIPEDEYPEQALAKLSKQQRRLLELLSQVNEINAIKVGSYPTQVEDEGSKKKRELLMSSFEQVTRVSIGQRIGPLHEYKLATKQYSLMQGVKTIESKQILIVLIDDSGSMRQEQKQSWIKAILLNRIASVLEGRSELYIARFETRTRGFTKVTTREEARKYYTEYAFGTGGITDIENVLQNVSLDLMKHRIEQYEIETKMQPHVLIINDGEDYIDERFRINSIVHAFVLGVTNYGLQKVVERSNGHYQEVEITDTGYL